ncbi:universal stress protein [Candidatus Halobonum tyrrellensis]|uniref:Universal stress protein UspA-like protein n=1 Tax=Candidatus Halobonum tyrrellensis G22 TaxID=1324957 RepID=V4HK30_9EURY|nr:universal stress protein [Candidatus Halobonum tyrrellensis]ESP90143.1 universal stress protein UspA-like protein [Candidatus Halobonum tyrrellensis G22]
MSTAPTHVVVPLDGSPLASEALVHALDTYDCRVSVLNVVTPLGDSMSEGGILEPDETRLEDARERTESMIETAKRRVSDPDRRVEPVVETGDPAETIIDYVEKHGVDHVVMGGHGGDRSELARRLLGTVATAVVSEAPATVTVVR